MSSDVRSPRKPPAPGESFKPGEVFRGIGAFVPERVAASTMLSMTAKLCYGHLARRAGQHARCWPSVRDIARHIGVEPRQATRALRELAEATLIRPISRKDATGRQTSNEYEFIWGPVLQGEGAISDILPGAISGGGRVSDVTPPGMTAKTPHELSKRNHHQASTQERSSEPNTTSPRSQNSDFDDDDPDVAKYASPKDELKALVIKAGSCLRVADLDSIEALLACRGIPWDAFVAEARGHSWNRITNSIGFLKSLAKKFSSKTQFAGAPVTAAEVEARDYKCPKCFSSTPGRGIRLEGNNIVPCDCTSPEFLAEVIECCARKTSSAVAADSPGGTGGVAGDLEVTGQGGGRNEHGPRWARG